MENILKINPSGTIPERSRGYPGFDQHKKKKKKPHHYVKGHLETLSQIVDEAHEALEQMNSPFRLCIYEKEGEIFIDVVTLDSQGKTVQVFRQDITYEELEDLIQQIKSGRGLVLDSSV